MKMFELIKSDLRINYVALQKPAMIISGLLIVASLLITVFLGPNYGIDFKGGSDIIVSFKSTVTDDQVRAAVEQAGFPDVSVQRFGTTDQNKFLVQTSAISVVSQAKVDEIVTKVGQLSEVQRKSWSLEQPDRLDLTLAAQVDMAAIQKAALDAGFEGVNVEKSGAESEAKYVVRFEDLSARVRKVFTTALPEAFNAETGLERMETVGPRVGNQLREDGLTSLFLALLAILIYVGVRFDMRYAPGAVAALFHDVIISFGILVLLRVEISLPILASMLTLIGYSLNDTIIIFDRIRENQTAGDGGTTLREIVNTSINETMTRTIITNLTTLFTVVMIFAFGSGLIKSFAFTLLIGIIIGTYSTIFIASPVMMFMDDWFASRREANELLAARQAAAAPAAVVDAEEA
jgi:preprotein translocase subunit SecF